MSHFARVGGFARRIAACAVVLVAAVAGGGPSSQADQPPRARSRWEGEIIYHIFPRSYRDSDGDRIGDFRGITAALATIDSLGCTAILLAPVVEARVYHNYFADDFFAVDRSFGSLDDFRTMVREAHGRGLKVILDMEPQYVADGHPWLRPAGAGAASPFADYLWRGGPLHGRLLRLVRPEAHRHLAGQPPQRRGAGLRRPGLPVLGRTGCGRIPDRPHDGRPRPAGGTDGAPGEPLGPAGARPATGVPARVLRRRAGRLGHGPGTSSRAPRPTRSSRSS